MSVCLSVNVLPSNHPSLFFFFFSRSSLVLTFQFKGFKKRLEKFPLAIGVTCNFTNLATESQKAAQEINHARQFKKPFFDSLRDKLGLDMENLVYYKDDTHYIVCTVKKQSLLNRGVLREDRPDVCAPSNVNRAALEKMCMDLASKDACNLGKSVTFVKLERRDGTWSNDCAIFPFNKKFRAHTPMRCFEAAEGDLLWTCVIGDALMEPFWPLGTGANRALLAAMDCAYHLIQVAMSGLTQRSATGCKERVRDVINSAVVTFNKLQQCSTPDILVAPSIKAGNSRLYGLHPLCRYTTRGASCKEEDAVLFTDAARAAVQAEWQQTPFEQATSDMLRGDRRFFLGYNFSASSADLNAERSPSPTRRMDIGSLDQVLQTSAISSSPLLPPRIEADQQRQERQPAAATASEEDADDQLDDQLGAEYWAQFGGTHAAKSREERARAGQKRLEHILVDKAAAEQRAMEESVRQAKERAEKAVAEQRAREESERKARAEEVEKAAVEQRAREESERKAAGVNPSVSPSPNPYLSSAQYVSGATAVSAIKQSTAPNPYIGGTGSIPYVSGAVRHGAATVFAGTGNNSSSTGLNPYVSDAAPSNNPYTRATSSGTPFSGSNSALPSSPYAGRVTSYPPQPYIGNNTGYQLQKTAPASNYAGSNPYASGYTSTGPSHVPPTGSIAPQNSSAPVIAGAYPPQAPPQYAEAVVAKQAEEARKRADEEASLLQFKGEQVSLRYHAQ